MFILILSLEFHLVCRPHLPIYTVASYPLPVRSSMLALYKYWLTACGEQLRQTKVSTVCIEQEYCDFKTRASGTAKQYISGTEN